LIVPFIGAIASPLTLVLDASTRQVDRFSLLQSTSD
jgi:hypothetical protein